MIFKNILKLVCYKTFIYSFNPYRLKLNLTQLLFKNHQTEIYQRGNTKEIKNVAFVFKKLIYYWGERLYIYISKTEAREHFDISSKTVE